MTDVRFALRMLRRSPAFSLAAIAIIALGIGLNTAVFSVVHGVLLKPLPYPAPDELVMLWQDMRARGGPADEWATPGNLADWRADTDTFSGVASIRGWAPAWTGAGDAEMLPGEQVTDGYFEVLGVQPAAGRSFRFDEALPNAPRVAIISHGLWQSRFGGEPVLGRMMTLAGEPHEIVGVMPAGFRPLINQNAQVWRPDRLNLATPVRGAIVLRVVARLQPGVTVDRATTTMSALAVRLGAQHPEFNANVGFRVVPLHEQVTGPSRAGVLVLQGAVVFVLLVACVNIANLLLARATGRAREMAVRAALGAGRARVIRQLLTESVTLSAIGGMLGVLVGVLGLRALVAMAPAGAARVDEIALDPLVLIVAAAATVVTGVLFGLAPALSVARAHQPAALRDGGRGSVGSSGRRVRQALIAVEIAVALVLLVGGGLLVRSLLQIQRADLGFDPVGRLSAFVTVPPNRLPEPADRVAFQDRLLESVAHLPGVTHAALTSILPFGGDSDMDFAIEGVAPPPAGQPGPATWYRVVSAGYFEAMGVRITRGRPFADREAGPVVVIGETLARRYWTDADPIGTRLRFSEDTPWFTIVGVAADVSQGGARGEPRGQTFIPYWQAGALLAGGTNIVLKTSVPPESLARPLADAVRALDSSLPVANVLPLTTLVGRSVEEPRFLALVTAMFGVCALVLAAIGVHGVMAQAAAERRQEMGVRIALGASSGAIWRLVFRDGLRVVAAGLALGGLGAALVAPALGSLLYGVAPRDPLTFVLAVGALVAASLWAMVLPAWRASRVDPAVTLRS